MRCVDTDVLWRDPTVFWMNWSAGVLACLFCSDGMAQIVAKFRVEVRDSPADSSFGSFQIDKNLKSLERCQSLEEIQRLFEAGDYKAVVHLLRPTLCTSGFDRAKHLEFMTSIPERPAQLLLLQVCACARARPCSQCPHGVCGHQRREAGRSRPGQGCGQEWVELEPGVQVLLFGGLKGSAHLTAVLPEGERMAKLSSTYLLISSP